MWEHSGNTPGVLLEYSWSTTGVFQEYSMLIEVEVEEKINKFNLIEEGFSASLSKKKIYNIKDINFSAKDKALFN